MRISWKKAVSIFLTILCLSTSLTGCKPSEKKVKQSEYYQSLKEKYDHLKEDNKKLRSQVEKDNQDSAEEERIINYLARIARNNLDKVEVGYYDDMERSEFVEQEESFILATAVAARANSTSRYTVEELENLYQPIYQYVLYDENNAIYEMTIYEGDYLVMADLPDVVFYCYNASALGKAFLHYKDGYPDSNLLHRLADSALVIDSKGNCFEQPQIADSANLILKMNKSKTNRHAAEEDWKKRRKKNKEGSYEPKSVTYTFWHHGNSMSLQIFDQYIRLENMDGKATWYKVSEEELAALKQLYVKSSSVYKRIKKMMKLEGREVVSMKEREDAENNASHAHDIDE